ncbi:hypothetical protein HQQ80_07855 [Microbacteriaceae bacterium VKM Ac-2855]|nr:hypothetical protein [Microbacteriaceae bacterium VKM Ac-2855]
MRSRTPQRLLGALAVTALAAGITLTTTAAASTTATSAEARTTAQDCWVLVDTGESLCVDQGEDLAAAVLDEKGYTMLESPDGGIVARGTLATYNLGTIFDDISYGGGSRTFQTSDPAICAVGKTYGDPDLRNSGWNDRVSSFLGYNGCRGVLFADITYIGSTYGPTSAAGWVGSSYNDLASSIQWVH